MDLSSSKKDTPIKKLGNSTNLSQVKRKDPIILDIWDLLNSIQSNVLSQDDHLIKINKKLKNLENNFYFMKTKLDHFHFELSQLKLGTLALS